MPEPKTTPTTAVTLTRLEGKVDTLLDDMAIVKKKIYGNGDPGIIIGQERQNSKLDQLLEIANRNAENIEALQKETTSKFLSRNWRTLLMVAVAFFLILHSILPADMSLWSWFSKFFGGG
jgi:hypothetical protein